MSTRVVAALAVVVAGCLDAVAGSTCALSPAVAVATPSRLDYLALASMADAQRPLAMAGYRPSTPSPQAAE